MADGSAYIAATNREAKLLPPHLRVIIDEAFEQSMLGSGSKDWFDFPSVRLSLAAQLKSLGNVQRKHGEISFLTHLMEVADRVYNHPRLQSFPAEYRAFVPINHDLEDICQKHGLAPNYVSSLALSALPEGVDYLVEARHSLFLLMDPPNVFDDERKNLQIERASELDLVGVYTRFYDKYCTYARDLRNMLTVNPKTGRPFFEIKSEQEAAAYKAKLDRKQEVIMALPVEPEDLRAWLSLRHKLDVMVARHIEPLVTARMGRHAVNNSKKPVAHRPGRRLPSSDAHFGLAAS